MQKLVMQKLVMQKLVMQKSIRILGLMCFSMSALLFVVLHVEHGMAKQRSAERVQTTQTDGLYDEFDGNAIYNQSDNKSVPNDHGDQSDMSRKSGTRVFDDGVIVTPLLNLDEIGPQTQEKTQNKTQNIEYSMTDAKHKLFKKENKDYALADAMLNFTWDALKRQANKQGSEQTSEEDDTQYNRDSYAKNLAEQRLWVEEKRNEVASSFSVHLSESNAFTLAIVARTQEIAEQIFVIPEAGIYLYGGDENTKGKKAKSKKSKTGNAQGQNIQGGHIVLSRDGKDIAITGQSFAKSGNTCEIEGKGSVDGKGWASFTSRKNEKFYILFTKDSAYVVHGKIALCGEKVSFQGVYEKKIN